jgi:hypothetical protein
MSGVAVIDYILKHGEVVCLPSDVTPDYEVSDYQPNYFTAGKTVEKTKTMNIFEKGMAEQAKRLWEKKQPDHVYMFPKQLRLSDPYLYQFMQRELPKHGMGITINYRCDVIVSSTVSPNLFQVHDIIFDPVNLSDLIGDILNSNAPFSEEEITEFRVFFGILRQYKIKHFIETT